MALNRLVAGPGRKRLPLHRHSTPTSRPTPGGGLSARRRALFRSAPNGGTHSERDAANLPNRSTIRLADSFVLDEWEISTRDTRPGEAVQATLYWHRNGPVSTNYIVFFQLWLLRTGFEQGFKQVNTLPGLGTCPTMRWPADTMWQGADAQRRDLTIFVHIYGVAEGMVGQEYGPRRQGQFPASLWQAKDIVQDRHCFSLLPDQELNRVEVVPYDPAIAQRLPAYDRDGRRLPNDTAILEVHQ